MENNNSGCISCRSIKPEDRQAERIKAANSYPPVTEGEYHTIVAMHDYCKKAVKEKKNTFVVYFHSKSTDWGKYKLAAAGWRDIMNAYIIEFPSICIRALLLGYSICGTIGSDQFFAGTFAWASCNHVAALPGLWNPLNNAFACEYFLFNVSNSWGGYRAEFPRHCAYASHEQNEVPDLYGGQIIPRRAYLQDIFDHINHFDMPPSILAKSLLKHNKKEHLRYFGEPCLGVDSDISKIAPYIDRPSWPGPDVHPSER
jgi:hypothetical protein